MGIYCKLPMRHHRKEEEENIAPLNEIANECRINAGRNPKNWEIVVEGKGLLAGMDVDVECLRIWY